MSTYVHALPQTCSLITIFFTKIVPVSFLFLLKLVVTHPSNCYHLSDLKGSTRYDLKEVKSNEDIARSSDILLLTIKIDRSS